MLSQFGSNILRLILWTFLPDYATRTTLRLLHEACHVAGTLNIPLPIPRTAPRPGTPAYARQHQATFALVILAYLAYNLVVSYTSASLNFYQTLGLNLGSAMTAEDVDENALKFAFRTFARKNHPDKVGPGGEAKFIAVRDAYEALKHPVTRAAHDRFGPDVLTWAGCTTSREYMQYGLIKSSGFYLGTTFFMLLFTIVGKGGSGEYWRYILLIGLAACELELIFNPSTTSSFSLASILNFFFPDRIAYQHVLFLHQVFIALCVAISRICPVVFPDPHILAEKAEMATVAAFAPVIQRLANITQVADREVSRMLHNELRSMHGVPTHGRTFTANDAPDDQIMAALTTEMENMIIDKNLKEHPMLRTLWDGAVRKKRNEYMLDRRTAPPLSRQASSRRDYLSPTPPLPSPPASITALPSVSSPPPEFEASPPPQFPPKMTRKPTFRSRSLSLTF